MKLVPSVLAGNADSTAPAVISEAGASRLHSVAGATEREFSTSISHRSNNAFLRNAYSLPIHGIAFPRNDYLLPIYGIAAPDTWYCIPEKC